MHLGFEKYLISVYLILISYFISDIHMLILKKGKLVLTLRQFLALTHCHQGTNGLSLRPSDPKDKDQCVNPSMRLLPICGFHLRASLLLLLFAVSNDALLIINNKWLSAGS